MAKSKTAVKEAEKGLKIENGLRSAVLEAQGIDRAVLNFGPVILNITLDLNDGIYGTMEYEGDVKTWHAELD